MRTVLIVLLFLTQIADLWTTSLVGVSREGNVLMSALWVARGYPVLIALKLGISSGLTVLYWLIIKYTPQYEKPYRAGLAASILAMIGVVVLNIIVL